MRKKIYIAGPMSSGDQIDNIAQALKAYRKLMELGFAPFCPQLTFFAEPFVKQSHYQWLEADLPWVGCADALLRLSGKSVGADIEVAYAKQNNIPVFEDIGIMFDALGEKR